MAELADAADSKSAEGNLVGVRPPLPAQINQSFTTEQLQQLLSTVPKLCPKKENRQTQRTMRTSALRREDKNSGRRSSGQRDGNRC